MSLQIIQSEDFLIEIIKKIDNPFYLVIMVLSGLSGVMFKSDILKSLKKVMNKKRVSKEPKVNSLKNHDVFPTMVRVNNEVNNMKFFTDQKYDETKTRMCSDFTRHKTEQCKVRMLSMVNKINIDSMNKNALKSYIYHEQNYMHELYIKAIKADWHSKGIRTEDINYVVQLFEKFRYDVVVSFENRINSIFSNEAYNTNYKLLLAVFEMWAMGIDLLPRDMLTTFESLNGRFKNLKYDYI